MVFHPGILALLLGGGLTTLLLFYGACLGLRILRSWDIASGSELQVLLERKTYLISTLMNYAFSFQFLSLFLFVFTADNMSSLFIGAMCAAGSLNVNGFGYPTVLLKIINSVLAGLWLIINYTDNRGYDYPLIKLKYVFLIFISPLIFSEFIVQSLYFFKLKPDIITSCCGALFSSEAMGITSGIIRLPVEPIMWSFYSSVTATILSGIYFYCFKRFALLFSLLSTLTFFTAIMALISFVSLYIYELPTHHCPFCLLKGEYHYIGYFLYVGFLGGIVFGLGVGTLAGFKEVQSLQLIIPQIQGHLALLSMGSYSFSVLLVLYSIMTSNLSLF